MLPLSDYGLIGNLSTGALVSRLGSVDWSCFPWLDSGPHFGALLDESRGGRFVIQPQGEFRSEQRYLVRTQVLETFFETPTGSGVLTDWMPVDEANQQLPAIHRKVTTLGGRIRWNVTCAPRFGSGREAPEVERSRGHVLFRGTREAELGFLVGDVALELEPDRGIAHGRADLEAGHSARLNWLWGRPAELTVAPALEASLLRWRSWAHHCPSFGPCPLSGPWHDVLARSGLVLRLLVCAGSGAVADSVAPARADEPRRASLWDSPLILRALSALGLVQERDAYFGWLCDVLERDGPAKLQSCYGLDGSRGHASRPFLLGILGQLAIAIDEYRHLTGALPPRSARALEELAEQACQAWRRPDQDPLEAPSRPEHYVSSKALCWSAIDRACRLLPKGAIQPRWRREREILRQTITAQGFDERAGSFVRSFSSREVGRGALFVPLLGILPPDDRRVEGTLRAVVKMNERSPALKGGLLLVSALARCGRIEQASELFEDLCSRASPLGLFAEELSGTEPKGAFPSASVHAALVSAALDIHTAVRDSREIHEKERPA